MDYNKLTREEILSRLEGQRHRIAELENALVEQTVDRDCPIQPELMCFEMLFSFDRPAIILDMEHKIVAANRPAEKLLADSQLTGKQCIQIYRQIDKEQDCPADRSLFSGQSFQGFWIIELGGMFLTTSCIPILGADGKMDHVLHLVKGIQEGSRLEKDLDQYTLYNTDNGERPDIFFIFSIKGEFLDCFSPDPEDHYIQSRIYLSKKIEHVLPPELSTNVLMAIGHVLETGKMLEIEHNFSQREADGYYRARFIASKSDRVYALVQKVSPKKIEPKKKIIGSFRAVMQSNSLSYVILDREGRILYDNPSEEFFLGYPIGKLVGMSIYELIDPAEKNQARILLGRLVKDGGVITTRCKLLTAKGDWRWVEVTATNLLHVPNISSIFIIYRDVDQRVAEEESLLRRNRELELLNRAIRHFISTLELDEVLALTLDGIQRLLQVTACSVWLLDPTTRELSCRQVTDPAAPVIRGWRLKPGQGLAGWVAEHGESLNVPDVQVDSRHYKGVDEKTGLPLRSILSVPLINKGNVVGVIQAVDTEPTRFAAEDQLIIESLAATAAGAIENARLYKALNASQEYTRNVIDSSMDIIITVDLNRRIVEFNKAAQEAFGYVPDEVIGRNVEVLYADANQALEIHEMTVINGRCAQRIDNRRKNGEIFPVHLSAATLKDASGRLVGVMGISRDISAQVMAEEKIRASLEEKEVLLREIHHRVKNNLQIISSMLKLQARSVQDEHLADMLRDSQSRIRSMALIHETLYQSPDLSRVNLKSYILTLASHLCQMYSFQERGIRLNVQGDDVTMDIDTAVPCGLIVTELLSNAFTHGFPIQMERDSSKGPGEIIVRLKQEGENCSLLVRDNGVGLDPDFEIENTESLGFRLVGALVKQLNGTIIIERQQGTSIMISFARIAYKKRR
ncbi:MAG: PAS domain S-box protein [Anaerolineales bacterium]|nr:PAS domain S-box protein [Anaerolineales bacterium]